MKSESDKELTKVIFKAVREINIENAIKSEPCYTLSDMLSAKNITALRKLGKLHSVKSYAKMDKITLIDAIKEKLTSRKLLTEYFYILNDLEWDFFKEAATKKDLQNDKLYVNSYLMLINIGLVQLYYHNDILTYVVPDEIKQVYTEIAKTNFPAEKTHSDLLNNYAMSVISLYGVISQEDFVELFNSQNERKTDIDEMFPILVKFSSLNYGYCFWDEYIVNDSFEENDFKDVAYYAKTAAAKPRYIPPKEELLKYVDGDYYEFTPQMAVLKYYINKKLSNDPDMTEDIIEEIHSFCFFEAKFDSFISLFEKFEIQLEFKQLQTLTQMIKDVQNNTRLWINNGHTPNELFNDDKNFLRPLPKDPLRVVKIGRNDPCPCGSGKKYKKCCGQ